MIGGVGRGRGVGDPAPGIQEGLGPIDQGAAIEGGIDDAMLVADRALGALDVVDGPDVPMLSTQTLPAPLEQALAAPSGHLFAAALDLGRAASALAAIVRRGPRPGETTAEKRLRELAARYLDLMQEAAAGMGRIVVG
jgi:hypothetical protein